tara:strand:+ start:921 stop:1148 length:228 start_codon:yes stop_codon:yes gene_type:complete
LQHQSIKQLETMNTQDKETAQLILSELLNDARIFDRLAEATELEIDNNSMIFHEIEEFIIDKFDEMQEEINNQNN